MLISSAPKFIHKLIIAFSFCEVVTWANNAKFFTNPHEDPSGVSLGHIMPHWEGCSDLGPLIFRVFSNWELIRVIIPKDDIYVIRFKSSVTPLRCILNLFTFQLPFDIELAKPCVIISLFIKLRIFIFSLPALIKVWSIVFFKSLLYFLNKSSKSSAIKFPANSNLLFP